MKRYKLAVDFRGILFVSLILLPNILWSLYPSLDYQFAEQTGLLQWAEQGLRILMIALLCCYTREPKEKGLYKKFGFWVSIFCVLIYYYGWYLLYFGQVNVLILFLLTLAPCLAFFTYALVTQNLIACLVILAFGLIHNYPTLMQLWK